MQGKDDVIVQLVFFTRFSPLTSYSWLQISLKRVPQMPTTATRQTASISKIISVINRPTEFPFFTRMQHVFLSLLCISNCPEPIDYLYISWFQPIRAPFTNLIGVFNRIKFHIMLNAAAPLCSGVYPELEEGWRSCFLGAVGREAKGRLKLREAVASEAGHRCLHEIKITSITKLSEAKYVGYFFDNSVISIANQWTWDSRRTECQDNQQQFQYHEWPDRRVQHDQRQC